MAAISTCKTPVIRIHLTSSHDGQLARDRLRRRVSDSRARDELGNKRAHEPGQALRSASRPVPSAHPDAHLPGSSFLSTSTTPDADCHGPYHETEDASLTTFSPSAVLFLDRNVLSASGLAYLGEDCIRIVVIYLSYEDGKMAARWSGPRIWVGVIGRRGVRGRLRQGLAVTSAGRLTHRLLVSGSPHRLADCDFAD
jgi:hypothetical protein